MKMQPLVALVKFPYAGKQRRPGDTFQASQRDARILIALRRAQADPAGRPEEVPQATETPPMALVVEAMEIPPQKPRARGRPRRVAEHAQ